VACAAAALAYTGQHNFIARTFFDAPIGHSGIIWVSIPPPPNCTKSHWQWSSQHALRWWLSRIRSVRVTGGEFPRDPAGCKWY
jgi:hypothetical protein